MGRHREFDLETALDHILHVFWRKGYEGATMADLEDATGLKKASLYAAIGNKRTMYLSAIQRYDETIVSETLTLLTKPGRAKQRFNRVFQAMIDSLDAPLGRLGCFFCNASIDQATTDRKTKQTVQSGLKRMETAFAAALSNEAAYSKNTKTRVQKAQELLAVYMGMRVMSKAGATQQELKGIKENILASI